MTFADLASLVVAYSDLIVVQDVIKAIDAPNPDLPNGYHHGQVEKNQNSGSPAVKNELSHRPLLPDTHAVKNRESTRNALCFSACLPLRRPDTYEPSCTPDCCQPIHKSVNPFDPIWKKIPPVIHDTVVIRPKVFVQKVDLINKGSLIDVFL